MALVGVPGGGSLKGFAIGKTSLLDFLFPFASNLLFTIYIKKVQYFYPMIIQAEILDQNETTEVPK